MSTCSACGEPESGATGGCPTCAATPEPFPREDFAPEAIAPRDTPRPAIDDSDGEVPRLDLRRRPVLGPASPSDAPAPLVHAAAVQAEIMERPHGARRRIPTGIRLVIRRHRKPAPLVAASRRAEPAPPPPRREPSNVELPPLRREPRDLELPPLEALRDREPPSEEARPHAAASTHAPPVADRPAAVPLPAPIARAAAVVEPPPPAEAAPPSRAPAPLILARPEPPQRAARPLQADRVRMREHAEAPRAPRAERPARKPRGPTLGDHLSGLMASPALRIVVASLVLLPIVAVLPSIAGLLLATWAALHLRRQARTGQRAGAFTEGLAGAALIASSITTALALLDLPLPGVVSALATPVRLLSLPVGVAGLAVVVACSLDLARRLRGAVLLTCATPLALTALAFAARTSAFAMLPLSAGLALAAALAASRSARDELLRDAARAWAVLAATVGALSALLLPLTGRFDPVAAGIASLLAATAATLAAVKASRSYDERERLSARWVSAAAAGCVALGVVLLARALGSSWAASLALLPFSCACHYVLRAVRARRLSATLDAAWMTQDARVIAALAALLALAAVLSQRSSSWLLPVALLSLAIALPVAAEWHARPRSPAGSACLLALSFATTLLAVGAGLPLPWAPVVAVALCCALVAGASRDLPGLREISWVVPATAAWAACLAAAFLVCWRGHAVAGLVGVTMAAAAPTTLFLLPRETWRRHAPHADPLALWPVHAGLAALVPLAPLVAWGHARWTVPALAVEAACAWLISRRRPVLLPAAAVLVGCVALSLPFLADGAGWWPGAVALALVFALGASEARLAAMQPARSTMRMAGLLAGTSGLLLLAWLSAQVGAAPAAMLTASVVLHATDRLSSDARLSRSLRDCGAVAWLAGAGLALLMLPVDPFSAALLLGLATATGLLVAALRREEWPAFLAGLAATTALAAACAGVGLDPVEHPVLGIAPAAVFVVAWGVIAAGRGRPANIYLAPGLVVLSLAVMAESHGPGGLPTMRAVAVALAATTLAGGLLARRRVPVIVGACTLLLEGAWAGIHGLGWIAAHPLPGLVGAGIIVTIVAGFLAHLVWRAGGRTALTLAWESDLARLREAWAAWP